MTASSRTVERRRDWTQAATPIRKRGEIIVVDGFGVAVRVERGRLVVSDGVGRHRRERRFSRATSRIARVVVLGGSGLVSLDAIRWISDVGAALVCINRDGGFLCGSTPTTSEAKLRRAQALAPHAETGLTVARTLLTAKLRGQRHLLNHLPLTDGYAERVLDRSIATVQAAGSIRDAIAAEAEAAAAYWRCWADVEVRFRPADRKRIPEHWRTFGQRSSPLGNGPRMATNPVGAILNYLYALLEAETRLACLIVGLDPALPIVHADIRGRDSLPLDLMEAVRPSVDRYLLALLRDRVFRSADFHETQRGSCRLLAPLTHALAETLPAWRELIAPVAEQVTALLLEREPTVPMLATPLTERNRRADRARRHHRTAPTNEPRPPKIERRCKRCGGPLPKRDRVYCDNCYGQYDHDRYQAFIAAGQAKKSRLAEAGVDPSHGGQAARRRGASMSRRRHEQAQWQRTNPSSSHDPQLFAREILPHLQTVPLSELVRATGLTRGYLSQIRRGLKTPHPRHWSALRAPKAELPTQP